jgi:hypothetical protein
MKPLNATSLKHWFNSSELLFALLFALVLGAVFEHQTEAHIAEINTPFGRHAAETIHYFYSLINPYRIYFLVGILSISTLLYFCETPSRKVTDLLGALLCVNVFFQILLLNLLLLTPMREGSLLLIQLLLFLPEINTPFGRLGCDHAYWPARSQLLYRLAENIQILHLSHQSSSNLRL